MSCVFSSISTTRVSSGVVIVMFSWVGSFSVSHEISIFISVGESVVSIIMVGSSITDLRRSSSVICKEVESMAESWVVFKD